MDKIQALFFSLEDRDAAWKEINETIEDVEVTGALSNNIEVNADFPNANSAAEIEQAFMQITNIATQRAYQNKR